MSSLKTPFIYVLFYFTFQWYENVSYFFKPPILFMFYFSKSGKSVPSSFITVKNNVLKYGSQYNFVDTNTGRGLQVFNISTLNEMLLLSYNTYACKSPLPGPPKVDNTLLQEPIGMTEVTFVSLLRGLSNK